MMTAEVDQHGSLNRRAVLATAAAVPLIAATTGLRFGRSQDRPNVLFIMADDLGYADVSCYGRREYQTPAIDSIARRGIRFLQSYSNSPVCSATRTALITGRYQNRLPIGLEEPLVGRPVGLPPGHPTLPSLLRGVGYHTALVGKWHLGEPPNYGPRKSGYDYFWGMHRGAIDYFSHGLGAQQDLWENETPIKRQGYITDLLGERSIALIRDGARRNEPWFQSLHFNAPHWPWEGPDDQAESERLAKASAGRGFRAYAEYDAGSLATYAKMVVGMDRAIGKILTALEATDQVRNTIVIFTSDNGGERFSDTWPFSGKKTELLEGGLRIPTIMQWPARLPAGRTTDQVMASMDWLPTLLTAAGASADPRFPSDGVALLDTLLAEKVLPDRTLCWRYLNRSQEACRSGRWKYLKILDNTFLFDIVADPLERANLKLRQPDKFAELVGKYRAWNAGMLPFDLTAQTDGISGAEMADHLGDPGVAIPSK